MGACNAVEPARGLSQEKICAELQRRGCDIGRTTYLIELRKIYGCSFDDFFAGLDSEEQN